MTAACSSGDSLAKDLPEKTIGRTVIECLVSTFLARRPQLGVLEDRALENVRRASAGTPMLLTRIDSGDTRPAIDRRGALANLVGRRLWLGEGHGLVKVVAVGPEPVQVDGRPSHTYREPGDTMVAYLCREHYGEPQPELQVWMAYGSWIPATQAQQLLGTAEALPAATLREILDPPTSRVFPVRPGLRVSTLFQMEGSRAPVWHEGIVRARDQTGQYEGTDNWQVYYFKDKDLWSVPLEAAGRRLRGTGERTLRTWTISAHWDNGAEDDLLRQMRGRGHRRGGGV